MRPQSLLRNIRIGQLKRMIYPLLFLCITGLILFSLPISEYFNVKSIAADLPLRNAVNERQAYIRSEASDLYYSGEDYYEDGVLTGHYYYQLSGSYCRFYILRPVAGKPADAYIARKTVTGRIVKYDANTEQLFIAFAGDLGWSTEGLASVCDPYLINEAIYFPLTEQLLFGVALLLLLPGILGFLYLFLLFCFPVLSPAILRLSRYGDRKQLLREAGEELCSHLLLQRKTLVLTNKYLMDFSNEFTAIIPLPSVLWVFETSRMKPVFRERREKMFYTLRIITITGDTFQIRDKEIRDIRKIEEVLTDHYPNFFYGYSEEHDHMVRFILRENRKELRENRKAASRKRRTRIRKLLQELIP